METDQERAEGATGPAATRTEPTPAGRPAGPDAQRLEGCLAAAAEHRRWVQLLACARCQAAICFEKFDARLPPEGERCEGCDRWVCPGCFGHAAGRCLGCPADRKEGT